MRKLIVSEFVSLDGIVGIVCFPKWAANESTVDLCSVTAARFVDGRSAERQNT
jgi:hypothetical protein